MANKPTNWRTNQMKIPEGYKLLIVNSDNEVIDSIEIGNYDLTKPFARDDILTSIDSVLHRSHPELHSSICLCFQCERKLK